MTNPAAVAGLFAEGVKSTAAPTQAGGRPAPSMGLPTTGAVGAVTALADTDHDRLAATALADHSLLG